MSRTTKIRDEELHKLRHHRKSGAHTPKRRPDPRAHDLTEWLQEVAGGPEEFEEGPTEGEIERLKFVLAMSSDEAHGYLERAEKAERELAEAREMLREAGRWLPLVVEQAAEVDPQPIWDLCNEIDACVGEAE